MSNTWTPITDPKNPLYGKSYEEVLAAVQQDGLVLQHVRDQTPEICLAALSNCQAAYRYIKEPTPEIVQAILDSIRQKMGPHDRLFEQLVGEDQQKTTEVLPASDAILPAEAHDFSCCALVKQCEGPKCMAWRWENQTNKVRSGLFSAEYQLKRTGKGYCGLVGER